MQNQRGVSIAFLWKQFFETLCLKIFSHFVAVALSSFCATLTKIHKRLHIQVPSTTTTTSSSDLLRKLVRLLITLDPTYQCSISFFEFETELKDAFGFASHLASPLTTTTTTTSAVSKCWRYSTALLQLNYPLKTCHSHKFFFRFKSINISFIF